MRHALLYVLAMPSLLAQSVTGTIAGTVSDPKGAAVPGAAVAATSKSTNARTAQATDENGFYKIANLVPGEYVVEVEAPGFRKALTAAQQLSAADVLRLDVKLEIGQISESVTVEAGAVEINTEDAQLGKTVRGISEMPLLSGDAGRNVLSLVGTQPGVIPATGSAFSAGGQRTTANNVMLDGADSNDDFLAGQPDSVPTISPNALAEFRLITGAMKAEYGRNSGSIVLVTTKSGGNALHGIASETFRNTKLNAVPFFFQSVPGGTSTLFTDGSPRKPQWNGNDFDVNLGGPVRKDRTFFFVSYLGFRRRQGVSTSATVPNDAERAAIDAFGRPEAKAILALIPRATSGNTLLSSPSDSQDRDQGLAKVDHYFSQANRFSATWFIDDQRDINPFVNANFPVPGFAVTNLIRYQNVVLRDTHSLSPRLFQELRASFHRRGDQLAIPLKHISMASLGLTGIVTDNPAVEGPPRVMISGFNQFGAGGNPRAFKRNGYHFIDNVSYTRGRHAWKFGGELRKYFPNAVNNVSNNGNVVIDGSGTSSGSPLVAQVIPGLSAALNDFANGFATSYSQASRVTVKPRVHMAPLFIQDDWKAAPNLTMNLGLRWEYSSPATDASGKSAAFHAGQKSTVFPDAPTGMVFPGDAGITKSTYQEHYRNLGPRAGFAWDPLKNGRLSIRGGYGIVYDAINPDIVAGGETALPFAVNAAVRNTHYANPWRDSLTNPIPQPFPFTPPAGGQRFDFTRYGTIGFSVIDQNFAAPYVQQWSLQAQTRIRSQWVAEVGYAGSVGVRLQTNKQFNPAVPEPDATTLNTDQRRVLNRNNPEDALYNGAVFGAIYKNSTDANSNYHSLQASLVRRFAHGFQMSHAYTWSHSIDNASNGDVTVTPGARIDNNRADRGSSAFDARHRYVATYLWELPAHGHVLGGWVISGITTLQTGLAFDINDNSGDRCLCTSGGQRPDYLGGPVQFFDVRSIGAWFDTAQFRRVGTGPSFAQGAGRFGSFGRDVFHGPGVNNWDLAALKRIAVRESRDLEFRAELINLFNHTQFLNPVSNIADPTFGRVNTTRPPRIAQLSLRLKF
jgi:hypothetical protein